MRLSAYYNDPEGCARPRSGLMRTAVSWVEIEARIRRVAFHATQVGMGSAMEAFAGSLISGDKASRIPLLVNALRERYHVEGNDAISVFRLFTCYTSELARSINLSDGMQFWP